MDSKKVLTPSEAAKILRVNPQSIRDQAHRDPTKLGFPVIILGSRVLIPKAAFEKYLKGAKR